MVTQGCGRHSSLSPQSPGDCRAPRRETQRPSTDLAGNHVSSLESLLFGLSFFSLFSFHPPLSPPSPFPQLLKERAFCEKAISPLGNSHLGKLRRPPLSFTALSWGGGEAGEERNQESGTLGALESSKGGEGISLSKYYVASDYFPYCVQQQNQTLGKNITAHGFTSFWAN